MQLALKFTRIDSAASTSGIKLTETNRRYLAKIMKPRTVGLPMSGSRLIHELRSVSRARVAPLIVDGRFLMHVDYRFGCGVEEWAEKIMGRYTWVCPHLCKRRDGARLPAEWWDWSRFEQFDNDVSDACDGGEVSESCAICPLDYSFSSRPLIPRNLASIEDRGSVPWYAIGPRDWT